MLGNVLFNCVRYQVQLKVKIEEMAQIVCKYLLILVESFKVSSSWPRFIILSLCVLDSFELRKIRRKNWGAKFNNYRSSSDSYVGPSSYTSSQVNDYPGYGNFGPLMNMKNPQISSSYSSFGPSSDSSSFGSTSYVNYPPTVEHQQINPQNLFSAAFASLQAHQGNSQRAPQFTSGEYKPASSYPASSYPVNSHSASSYPTHSNSATSYQILSNPASSYQNSNSYSSQSWPHASLGHHTGTSSYGEATPISQHVEITKPVAVPVYKKFPYPVSKNFSVAIPHPVLG